MILPVKIRRTIMRHLVVLIVALFLSSALDGQVPSADVNHQQTGTAPQPGDDLRNPSIDKRSSALDGKELFVQHCASCHGSEGLGNGPAGASVIPKPDNLTSDEIHKQSDGALFLGISNGAHGVMISWKFILSDTQRWHLVDYIRELRKNSK
jgi:mono/diheme cytochrome c family protein